MATLSIYCLTLIIPYACFKEGKSLKPFFSWLTAGSVRELVDGIITILVLLLGFNPRVVIPNVFSNEYLNFILYDLIHFIPLALPLLFFRKKFSLNEDKILNKKAFLISISFLIDLVIIKTFIVYFANNDLMLYGVCSSQEIVLSLFFLFFRSGALNENNYRSEIKVMEKVLLNEQKQYEDLRENIELINIKAHDIKHQLENLSSKLTKEEIDEMKKAIEDYDSQVHSGNQVVDTVLYSTTLKCRNQGIAFTSLVDGKLFDGYGQNEIYSLLSNILNNAIEATKNLKNLDERLISFNVRKSNDSILIEECNYFEGELHVSKSGLLKTTKEDKSSHGYGMKSIKYIVEENDGALLFEQKENMFFLKVSLPIRTEA